MSHLKKTWTTRARGQILAELARRDVNIFCEFCFRGPDGKPWMQQPFHKEWQALLPLEGPARILIGAPRESAKTSQLSIARVIWELGHNPNQRVKIITSTDDLAADIVGSIADHILRNSRIRQVFPRLRPASAGLWPKAGARSSRLVIVRPSQNKDPSVSGHGILSTGVGGRADFIIFDDVVDFRNAIAAPALRGQVAQSLLEVWINLLGPEGRAVYIGTVWHQGDLTMQLKQNSEWTVWWRAARDEVSGDLLWPECWNEEALAAREREIGSRAFARQYLLQPLSDEERTFPSFEKCLEYGVSWRQIVGEHWRYYTGVDLSSKSRAGTVVVTVAVAKEGLRVPVDVRVLSNPSALPDALVAIYETFRPQAILVENNATQDVILDMVRTATGLRQMLPLQPFTTGAQKLDPELGLPGLEVEFANRMWRIAVECEPRSSDSDADPWTRFVREFTGHPLGQTDDLVMATWFARQAIAKKKPLLLGPQDELVRPSPFRFPGDPIGRSGAPGLGPHEIEGDPDDWREEYRKGEVRPRRRGSMLF